MKTLSLQIFLVAMLSVVFLGPLVQAAQIPQTKCDEVGFQHAWKDITSGATQHAAPWNSPDLNKKEECMNCGLVRVWRIEPKKYWEYSPPKKSSKEEAND